VPILFWTKLNDFLIYNLFLLRLFKFHSATFHLVKEFSRHFVEKHLTDRRLVDTHAQYKNETCSCRPWWWLSQRNIVSTKMISTKSFLTKKFSTKRFSTKSFSTKRHWTRQKGSFLIRRSSSLASPLKSCCRFFFFLVFSLFISMFCFPTFISFFFHPAGHR
jgi:hypothetical protein